MNVQISKANSQNVLAIIELMREFAEFENLTDFVEVTEENLSNAMFGEDSFVEGLIAFDGKTPVAYAIFFQYFSSFRGQKSVYLEDPFVTSKLRKSGIGEKMLKTIARIGKKRGAVRMDFQVLDRNENAINFYKKHGAEFHASERHFLFTGKVFEELASEM